MYQSENIGVMCR